MRQLDSTTKTRLTLFARSAIFATIAFTLVMYAGEVLKPARQGNVIGGAWASFRAQAPNSIDVMVFGTSHAFTGVDPGEIWRETGIPSFVLAGPVQRPEITEHYVNEALASQRPRVVAYELVGMSYPPEKFDANFHLINVGYMPMSTNRLKAVAFDTPWGEKSNVLVDVWAHHSRWPQLRRKDFRVAGKHRGFEYLRGHIPMIGTHGVIPTETAAAVTAPLDTRPSENIAFNMPALERIAAECQRRDIELMLFLAPTAPPGQYNRVLRDVERSIHKDYPDVRVVDFSLPRAVPELVLSDDFYDGGHLNQAGSEKFSRAFGSYVRDAYRLPSRKGDPAYRDWEHDVAERDAYLRKLGAAAKAKEQAKADAQNEATRP